MARLRIAGVVPESVVDGPGFRYTVFTQGCRHNCKGCHNPQTHDFNGGYLVDTDDLFNEMMEDPLIRGMTFSGGDPFEQPVPLACRKSARRRQGYYGILRLHLRAADGKGEV